MIISMPLDGTSWIPYLASFRHNNSDVIRARFWSDPEPCVPKNCEFGGIG